MDEASQKYPAEPTALPYSGLEVRPEPPLALESHKATAANVVLATQPEYREAHARPRFWKRYWLWILLILLLIGAVVGGGVGGTINKNKCCVPLPNSTNPNSVNPSTSPTTTPSSRVTPTSGPVTFTAVYGQGGLNQGIGGWDFQSSSDRSFPFDYDHNGKLDYVVIYRPKVGAIYIVKNANGTFTPVYQQGEGGKGIGKFDLHESGIFAFAFDYEHSGNLDYLVFYIPGDGTFWILKNVNGNFSAVYAEGSPGNGIGGYDFSSPQDRAFAFDYDHSGRLDHIAIYRPGHGVFWILANVNGNFSPVYKGSPGSGIGGYDLASTADVAFAFDYAQSGRMDYIILYRPGTGTISILEHGAGNNNFTAIYQQGDPGSGIGGFGISSPADLAFAFDYASAGRQDYLVFYRPGTGIFWILQNSNGTFAPVYGQTDPGVGIGGYNLSSPVDLAYAFDYKQSGNLDHIILYRPGDGLVYIVEKS